MRINLETRHCQRHHQTIETSAFSKSFVFKMHIFLTALKCHQRSQIYAHWWAIRLSVEGTLLDRGIAEKSDIYDSLNHWGRPNTSRSVVKNSLLPTNRYSFVSEAPKPEPKNVEPNLRFVSENSVIMSSSIPADPNIGPKEELPFIPPHTKFSWSTGFGYIFFGAHPVGLCKLNRKDDGHEIQSLRSEAEISRNENKKQIKTEVTKNGT